MLVGTVHVRKGQQPCFTRVGSMRIMHASCTDTVPLRHCPLGRLLHPTSMDSQPEQGESCAAQSSGRRRVNHVSSSLFLHFFVTYTRVVTSSTFRVYSPA